MIKARAGARQVNKAYNALKCSTRRYQSSMSATPKQLEEGLLTNPLEKEDPEIFNIIEHEKKRQLESIVLIASENYTSKAVMQALGSVMQNKYSEGYPNARYYAGNEWIDKSELLCQKRALECFGLDPEKWGVNVQSLSGAPANLYVYGALMKPHERLMGLDLPHGGHLSHGYQLPTKKISMVSSYFETLPYHCNTETGLIDYDELEKSALVYRPKIIVAGASAYARAMDYARLREICDKVGCYLMADIAHISGLVAAKVMPGPFEHADIVTTTTHKSLRGPRGAMIFFRKGEREVKKKGASAKKTGPVMYDLEQPINASVFPGHQGGPHNHTITALAVALKQAQSPEFIQYQQQVLDNSKALAKSLIDRGFQLATGGTDNHLILADVMSSKGIDGARSERVLELASIITNKNTIVGDRSAVIPSGIRMGTPAMTSRGLVEKDFEQIAKFFDQGVKIAHDLAKTRFTASKFGMFKTELGSNVENVPELAALKKDVVSFSSSFPTVGFGKADMKL